MLEKYKGRKVYVEALSKVKILKLLHGTTPFVSANAVRIAKSEITQSKLASKNVIRDLEILEEKLKQDTSLSPESALPGFIR